MMFTNERILLGNIVPMVHSCNAQRDLPMLHGAPIDRQQGVAINGDSTYKVGYEGGWKLVGFFTHAVKFTQVTCTHPRFHSAVTVQSHCSHSAVTV